MLQLKKSKLKSDKLQQNKQNKQNKQTTMFSAKINKVFWAQFYKILREGPFWTIFFWKWSSRRAEADANKQKVLSFQEVSQKCKIVIKIEFTPLDHSPERKIFPFKKGFLKK